MIFYTYDEKTKEYTGTQNAFIDPLETKNQTKAVTQYTADSDDKYFKSLSMIKDFS